MSQSISPDIAPLPQWDLSDLYPAMDCPELTRDFVRLEKLSTEFATSFKGKLSGLTATEILDSVVRYEEIEDIMGRIMSYASLLHAGDVTDADISKFYQSCTEKITRINTVILFYSLEINRIDEAQINGWFEQSTALARYRPWFDIVRQYRPHQLEERLEEFIMDNSVAGNSAWIRLFDDSMAGLKFDFSDPASGKTHSLGLEQTLDHMSDSDGKKRKAAAECLSATFKDNIRLFTHITNSLAKGKEIEDRWRHFKTPDSSRHLSNQLEKPVVDALVSAVKDAYPRLSHRYYRLKANWFGKEKLDWRDRNAPLPGSDNKLYPWRQAQRIVLEAYGKFSPEMANLGRKFFDNNWIDAKVRDNKSPGAFAHPTVPGVHPYLLLNYMGKSRDVMTLAHELGHGVHQLLAAPQGALLSDTPLTLAETASVFGEMLTFRSLLSEEQDPELKKIMIAAKVEDMLNTVVRQIAFYDFEQRVHAGRRKSELSADDLGDIWMAVQRESLGDAIAFDDDYRTFWCYIPHFIHSPFYVYAYAFGDCLVNSLYATYLNSPHGFQDKYFTMLRAGGSQRHRELLRPFNLDAGNPDFWATGLNMISELIDTIE